MCYCSDNIMKVKNVDFHNILLDEKSYKYILTYISQKTYMGAKLLHIRFDKADGVYDDDDDDDDDRKFMTKPDIQNYLVLEYIMQFIKGLIIL